MHIVSLVMLLFDYEANWSNFVVCVSVEMCEEREWYLSNMVSMSWLSNSKEMYKHPLSNLPIFMYSVMRNWPEEKFDLELLMTLTYQWPYLWS